MRKYHTGFAIIALFIAQQSFANVTTMSSSNNSDDMSLKQCDMIAKACLKAGYARKAMTGKGFWRDCMKPVLLNQEVKGVTLNANDIATCRQAKITKMESELEMLKQVK